jgi:1-acyl-sn-glycerol-3-phosphate acyltransferase
LCCRSFGVKIKILNAPTVGAPGLIIGNHMGFIDILAIGGNRPMLFVTSQEMRETPFLGLLTEMAGCIYVERRNRSASQNELHNIIQSLQQGFNVCLFPEATSHDGSLVLPFKRTLMSAAAHAQVPIYPYVFNFTSINGEKFHINNRVKVCWYGDIPFVKSLMAALSLKSVECEIKFLDPFYPTLDMERAFVADEMHRRISAEFKPYATN